MAVTESFADVVAKAYATTGPAIELGRGVHDGAVAHDVLVQVPLAMMNRHGLIAGATGTGKTKTLQGLAEQLSAAGVPVVVTDTKGDLSGLAVPGATDGPAPKRAADLGEPFTPAAFPVEFLALGGLGPGVPVRATVTDFGPQLLAKVLGANDTQEQSLHLVFRYADERKLALLDLADLRAVLSYLESDEGRADLSSIGGVSPATIGVLLRSLAGLEDRGGNEFFGEPQFDISDLMRTAADGRGVISSLELAAVQDRPALFSTALMWMVAELFEQLPEVGDLEKPKLVFFFDEAHLLFDDATEAFLQSVTQTVRLIRSKGVGVFFVTQSPKDVPADVLGQLGNRIQHALRAFTPDDAKALRSTVSTYPRSEFYDLEQLLTQLAIGEAVVTILSESGVPTPVVHTRMRAPQSRMSPVDDIAGPARASPLYARYGTAIDTQSAREILAARMAQSSAAAAAARPAPSAKPARSKKARPAARSAGKPASGGALGTLGDLLASSQGKAIEKEVVRGVFGMLKKRF